MNKKNLLFIVVLLIFALGFSFWYFRPTPSATNEESNSIIGNFFGGLFPDAGLLGNDDSEIETPGGEGLGEVSTSTPSDAERAKLYQLVTERVSGAVFLKTTATTTGKIRYVERATGHVYDINPTGKNKTRISNTTMPGVFEVAWAPDGSRAVMQYISESGLNILSAKFTASTTQGIFLPSNITEVAFSPKGDRIAYVTETAAEGILTIASPENKNQKVLFRNPVTSWKFLWPEETSIYIFNTPSAFLDGFLYKIATAAGSFEKITGPRLGLLFSTNGQYLLLAESDRDNKTIYNSTVDLKTKEVTQIGTKIVPEKCAWSKKEKGVAFCALFDPFPSALMPDDWYKGKILFADSVAKINFSEPAITKIEFEEFIDVYKPFLSEDEQELFFINRVDGTLWAMELQ